MKKPRILLWDLETAGLNSFHADLAAVVVFGYKWLGEKTTHALTIDQFPGWFKNNELHDKGLLTAMLRIMDEADLLVAHYGDRFDRRFFQGRCAINGLRPPPPTKQRDTWRIARTAFNFRSNRLGNIAMALGLDQKKYQKKGRNEWPGWWHRTMGGDPKALASMAKYCKQDVRTLEAIYLAIRAYDNPHPRMHNRRSQCRLCGSEHINYHGFAFVGENRYRRYRCQDCGRWDRDRRKA